MEFRDYWLTIRRRWMTVVATLLVGIGVAGLVSWQTTPEYESSAQLFVRTASSNSNEGLTGGQFATQRVASYVNLVSTREMAESVAAKLDGRVGAGDAQASVSAAAIPDTVGMVIAARHPDPALAAAIANAYAEALQERVAKIESPELADSDEVTEEEQRLAPIYVEIVDEALVPVDPVSPNVPLNLLLGLVVGLLLGLALAVLRDLLDTTVGSDDDVADVTTRPVLGHINADPSTAGRRPVAALSDPTPWGEAFRVLRTNMQYVELGRERRVFVISSSVAGEGKSTVAANLGAALALAGDSTCIVECDLRRPTMAARLGLDGEVGTTSVLIGRLTLDEALQRYGDTGLRVLTSGPRPPNPSELLQSQSMEKLVEELRERFAVVLLDAPPLLPVTDAALLAARADGLVAVVRHGRTTRDQLRHALDRVETVGASCVGVVMNMVPARGRGGGYSYSYYGSPYVESSRRSPLRRFRPSRRRRRGSRSSGARARHAG